MKTMLKSELAERAGVSVSTFKRWLAMHRAELQTLGVAPKSKLVNPLAVRWICDKYGIDL